MIKAGTEIRDRAGNVVVTVLVDLGPWSANDHRHFRMPNGEHPIPGEPMPVEVISYLSDHLNEDD